MAFVFNAANAPFVTLLRARGIPAAVHVDGLEWLREKWGGAGRAYYRWAEQIGGAECRCAHRRRPRHRRPLRVAYGAPTRLISYGAPVQLKPPSDRLSELGLSWKGFHLVVARFEPENHVDMMVAGYVRSNAGLPAGGRRLRSVRRGVHQAGAGGAGDDARVRLLGGVYDQDLLDQLYAGALCYLHGHSVGGTNPSLLRAMGAGSAVLAWDVSFNREVAGERGRYFADDSSLAAMIEAAEMTPADTERDGVALREIVRANYRWDDVAVAYEALAGDLKAGASSRARARRGELAAPRPATSRTTGFSPAGAHGRIH